MADNMENTITLIGILISFALGLISLVWQIIRERQQSIREAKRLPAENMESGGSAAESYAKAAEIKAKENIELSLRLEKAEEKMGVLEKEQKDNIAAFEKERRETALIVAELKEYVEELKEYIDRLSHQVISLGGTPVPMKKKKSAES